MKAQVSLDFMLSILAALMFFLLIIVYANDRFHDASSIITNQDAKTKAKTLALAINDVYLSGDGSYRNITLASTLYGGRTYTIKVYPNSVTLSYTLDSDRDVSYRTITSSIDGIGGGLSINPGLIIITNSEGVIQIKNG